MRSHCKREPRYGNHDHPHDYRAKEAAFFPGYQKGGNSGPEEDVAQSQVDVSLLHEQRWEQHRRQHGYRYVAQPLDDQRRQGFGRQHPNRQEAWDVMMQRSDLTWIIPTKRTKEAQKWFEQHKCPDNVWLLASVGHESTTHRIPELLAIDAPVRGLSMEPLLGSVDVKLNRWVCSQCGDWTEGPILDDDNHCKCDYYVEERLKNQLDWVIIGGESGPHRRPCKLEWVRDLIEQCDAAGVAVFVKQLSIKGRVSKDPAEWPIWARRREMP